MNIRDLQYLVALADLNHFGKAADACFVSQPALSMQIKKLEEHLGVKLLERNNKSVMLTDSGITIVERARQILQQVDEMREIAHSAKDPLSGELRIGIFPTLAPYLLPLIIPKLTQLFPNLSFYLLEEQTHVLIEKIKQGKIHAALLASPIADDSLNDNPLFEEEFLLAVPKNHALAKLKSVKQQDLDQQNLLLLNEGHCLREQALSLCYRMNADEAKNFQATSLETLRHMIAAGVGITLMPKLACNMNDSTISYIPFAQPYRPSRVINLFWRETSTKQIALKKITEEIKKIMTKNKMVKIIKTR